MQKSNLLQNLLMTSQEKQYDTPRSLSPHPEGKSRSGSAHRRSHNRPKMRTKTTYLKNRPFAQLLPGLETGYPVTVGQSPAYDFSVSDEQKAVFLVSVSDCSLSDSYAGD